MPSLRFVPASLPRGSEEDAAGDASVDPASWEKYVGEGAEVFWLVDDCIDTAGEEKVPAGFPIVDWPFIPR